MNDDDDSESETVSFFISSRTTAVSRDSHTPTERIAARSSDSTPDARPSQITAKAGENCG